MLFTCGFSNLVGIKAYLLSNHTKLAPRCKDSLILSRYCRMRNEREGVSRPKNRVTRRVNDFLEGGLIGCPAISVPLSERRGSSAGLSRVNFTAPKRSPNQGLQRCGFGGLSAVRAAALGLIVALRRSWENLCFRQKSRGAAGQVPPLLSFAALAR